MTTISEFKFFYPEKPRLLHVDQPFFEELNNNPQWISEPKFNGNRLQLHHLPSGAFQFWNRHGKLLDYTPSPELKADLERLNLEGYWLFDGELRHHKVKGVRHRVVLYDLFICRGDLLCSLPFQDRRGVLETLFHYYGPDTGENLDLAVQYDQGFRERFQSYTDDPEIEGLVIKNLAGRLQLGRNRAVDSSWMWKVRKPNNSYRF
jgi:ATP-dependent DNA ligase